jgi:hypothetical protein
MTTSAHSRSSRAIVARQRAHRDTVAIVTADIARFLVDLLGLGLVSEMCGVESSTVTRWMDSTTPTTTNERRLRLAYQVARLLLEADSTYVVRAWFIGMNPMLDDDSPSEAIAQDRLREVMTAARLYAEV